MSEIKVGEYIRTKGGYIGKVEHITKGYKFRTTTGHIATGQERYLLDNRKSISKPYVTKHSKNIIDLIEVKDIIQIRRGLYDDYNFIFICSDEDIISAEETIKDYAINILTHEFYEQNCYKVGDIE